MGTERRLVLKNAMNKHVTHNNNTTQFSYYKNLKNKGLRVSPVSKQCQHFSLHSPTSPTWHH